MLFIQGHVLTVKGHIHLIQNVGRRFLPQQDTHGYTEIGRDLLGSLGADALFSAHFQICHQCATEPKLIAKPAGTDSAGLTKLLNVPVVLLAALLAAFGSVFYAPAISTLMIDIIPRAEMVRGQSLHSGVVSLINLVGTAFSGAMVAFFGVPLIVVINGISNLYSAVTELLVHVPRTVQQGTPVTGKGILRDTARAVKTIFSDGCLRLFVPCALILNLLGAGPMALLLPFCMEKGFSVDMYGYLVSVSTAAYLLCVLILGIVKLRSRARFWVMALGFSSSVVLYSLAYLSKGFLPVCVLSFLGSLANGAGNAVFNASLMLALPQENRSAILGFIQSASSGGTALSAVLFGLLGEVCPLYLVFVAGNVLSLGPMLYLCFHPQTKAFVLENSE